MTTVLYFHLFSAWASLILFIFRGVLQWQGKDWRQYKILCILPHIADTILLVTGLTFLIVFNFSLVDWLLIKIVALVLYIIFAAKAFKRQRPQNTFLPLALICFLVAMLLGYFH
ncbi:hypothetical protein QV08_01975 [Gallibacterium salpingitidis]|uniref:Invasion gene expression up-regulator, SirB n=1 Tax=Gallibacterium salpingitidis TaxID=505341 RepID=A0AB36E2U3_9PAST|nr:SirB2 family protein [Gallibacterium salpingitidis]OBX09236.1 hypothetical protein QV08_01975 [Gallibacterium salpingitidis]OBX10633.1 hypothetical protein QV09_04815 [Gallibacterium salpingitidis]WKT00207.1 SirB2 family protein [Gallibacterium salpingitidis]